MIPHIFSALNKIKSTLAISMHRSTLGSSAAGASRFGLARPKELRARENDFYCIFERIGHRTEVGQPRLLGT